MSKVQQAQPAAGSRGRRGRRARLSTSLSEINVVPLVDVMLVLLIIFMVTAPMIQRGLDVALPVARRSAQISSERLVITIPLAYRENSLVQFNDELVRVEVLEERVRQALLTQAQHNVFLRGDGGITYQELMSVMDRLKAAGVQDLGLVTSLPGER